MTTGRGFASSIPVTELVSRTNHFPINLFDDSVNLLPIRHRNARAIYPHSRFGSKSATQLVRLTATIEILMYIYKNHDSPVL